MNWDAIGAIGEALGAGAVFITLIYLAVQVRHARAEVARSVVHSRTTAAREHNLALALNERIDLITRKANTNLGGANLPVVDVLVERAGLTPEEADTFIHAQVARWQFQTQIIDDLPEMSGGHRAEFKNFVRGVYGANQPATQLWYQTVKSSLNPDAVRHIDAILAEPG
jgi:hypothetical protein